MADLRRGDFLVVCATITVRRHCRSDSAIKLTLSQRRLHQQSVELVKNVTSLSPHEDKRLATRGLHVRQTDLCGSYYWRGRVFVILLEMRQAKFWLDKAWKMCPEGASQQRRWVDFARPRSP
jgi:hypothetical protein